MATGQYQESSIGRSILFIHDGKNVSSDGNESDKECNSRYRSDECNEAGNSLCIIFRFALMGF